MLAGRHKHTIEAFHNLACLEVMRCYACGIHRILIYFDVRFNIVEILCCKWAFKRQFCQGQLVLCFSRGPLQGPSRRLSKALALAVDFLLTVLNDMFEASANLGWKLGVETFDAFLAVAEDDCSGRKVSGHTGLVALRGTSWRSTHTSL